jgi:hypothetical protein
VSTHSIRIGFRCTEWCGNRALCRIHALLKTTRFLTVYAFSADPGPYPSLFTKNVASNPILIVETVVGDVRKTHFIENYDDEAEAARECNSAMLPLAGEFARLNEV